MNVQDIISNSGKEWEQRYGGICDILFLSSLDPQFAHIYQKIQRDAGFGTFMYSIWARLSRTHFH